MLRARVGKRNWIITLVLASSALLYTFLIFLPNQKAIGKLRRELQEKQMFMVQSERLVSAVSRTSREVREAETFTQRWKDAAPSIETVSQFLAKVTDVAEQSQVNIVRVEPGAANQLQTVRIVPYRFVVDGEFAEIFGFLAAVEEMPEANWIHSLTLSRHNEIGESAQAAFELLVFVDNSEDSDYGELPALR